MRTTATVAIPAGLALILMHAWEATAWGNKSRRVHQHFAGGSVFELGVEETRGPIARGSSLVVARAKGMPGRATLLLRTKFGEFAPGPDCPTDTLQQGLQNVSLVETFLDLSQIFGFATSGVICLDPATGTSELALEGVYTGGTRRFEGASGSFSVVGTSQAVDARTRVFQISGIVEGTIELP